MTNAILIGIIVGSVFGSIGAILAYQLVKRS